MNLRVIYVAEVSTRVPIPQLKKKKIGVLQGRWTILRATTKIWYSQINKQNIALKKNKVEVDDVKR